MNIHLNDDYFSIMIRHDLDHTNVRKDLDEKLLTRIKEMSLHFAPSQIFKSLKSELAVEQLLDLTLSQVFKSD